MLNLRKNQNQPAQLSIMAKKMIPDKVCYKCFRVVTEAPLLVKLDGHRLGTFNFSKKYCLIITLDGSELITKILELQKIQLTKLSSLYVRTPGSYSYK